MTSKSACQLPAASGQTRPPETAAGKWKSQCSRTVASSQLPLAVIHYEDEILPDNRQRHKKRRPQKGAAKVKENQIG